MAVGYWISVGGIMISRGIVDAGADQTAAFIVGFIVGMVLWAFAMAFAVRWGKKILNPTAFRVVTFACGAIMLIFGVSLASQMFTSLL
jgi:arginine exporter protein ArgO